MIKITGVHPAAEAWPMLDEADLRLLADDIRTNGQLYPIIATKAGLIVAGRNRYAACQIAGVAPTVEIRDLTDDQVRALVVSENRRRRHMPESALAAAEALTWGPTKRKNGRWVYGTLAEIPDSGNSKTQRNALNQCGVVLDQCPDLLPQVRDETLALDAAYKKAQEKKAEKDRRSSLPADLRALVEAGSITDDEAERRVREQERLGQLPDDLADRVRAGHITTDEAEAIHREQQERLDIWVDKVDQALTVLVRMIGYPIPDGFAERLSESKYKALQEILTRSEGVTLDD